MSYGYGSTNGGKSYEQMLDEMIEDEMKAGLEYEHMAMLAEQKDMRITAELIRSIAKDENKHYGMLTDIKMLPEATPRPTGYTLFPRTLSDWGLLRDKIVEKYPYDAPMRATVNFQYGKVENANSYYTSNDIDDAKRWLAEEAGRLGIQ